MLDERVADDLAGPGDDVQHTCREPGLERELGVAQRAERREARRLEDDAVAGCDRRGGLPVADVEREVPRRDQRRDADRLAERQQDAVTVDRDRVAEELVHGAGVVAHHGGRVADAPARVADRHPHVARLEQAELVDVLLEQVGPAVQHLRPLDRGALTPVLERTSCGADRAVDVLGARFGDRAEHAAGRGVDRVEGAPLRGFDARAVDQESLRHRAPLLSSAVPADRANGSYDASRTSAPGHRGSVNPLAREVDKAGCDPCAGSAGRASSRRRGEADPCSARARGAARRPRSASPRWASRSSTAIFASCAANRVFGVFGDQTQAEVFGRTIDEVLPAARAADRPGDGQGPRDRGAGGRQPRSCARDPDDPENTRYFRTFRWPGRLDRRRDRGRHVDRDRDHRPAEERRSSATTRSRATAPIFDGASIGIVRADRTGRVIEANPAMEQMLGYTAAELAAMRFQEYTHPDDVEQNLRLFNEIMDGPRDAYQFEKRCFRKDGQMIWLRVTSVAERGRRTAGAPTRSRCSRTSPSASSPSRRISSRPG